MTTRRLLLTSFTILALLAAVSPAGEGGADREKIQGRWKVISQGGREPPDRPGPPPVRITADTFTVMHEEEGDRLGFRYTIDPGKAPTHFDAFPEEDPGKPIPQAGIYKLEGDTLTIALASAGRPRPDDFAAAPGVHVMVLERIKK